MPPSRLSSSRLLPVLLLAVDQMASLRTRSHANVHIPNGHGGKVDEVPVNQVKLHEV